NMVIFSAALAALGAFLFARETRDSWLRRRSMLATVLIAALGTTNLFMASQRKSLLELHWMREELAEYPVYEKWNSFSRVVVAGDPGVSHRPVTWGLSPVYKIHAMVRQLSVLIDAGALTVMTHYEGNF